jgi:ferrous iron transport protein B
MAIIEDSGYLSRAAFLMDSLMSRMGLDGRSFVMMLMGFGCNVPAIMSARTLEYKRDRILTVMMTPFMSCGARLAIFAVFAAAFFPQGGQNIVFLLYLTGITMAVLTGWLLQKTILQGESAPMVMELPPYHWPRLGYLIQQTWQRLKQFIIRAGRLIIPVCVLIGVLNGITLSAGTSLLAAMGQLFTPLFAPMGITPSNWPATVGLLTGILAKEVVIGSLNALYSQMGHGAHLSQTLHFWQGLQQAALSIPHNLLQLPQTLINPVAASAPQQAVQQGSLGMMVQQFGSKSSACAYMLFVLLYIPCVSTIAVTWRELGRAWASFSIAWNSLSAYALAVLFYQIALWPQHPGIASLWCVAIIASFMGVFAGLKLYSQLTKQARYSRLSYHY